MRNSFEARLTCRNCGRRLPESMFATSMSCLDCVTRVERRKQRIMEERLADQRGRETRKAEGRK
jgi:hypothetical protein